MQHTVYILLGGNIGEVHKTFNRVKEIISIKVGSIVKQSAVYQTEPWGFKSNLPFLNQVIEVRTGLSAPTVMHELKNIESMLGRIRNLEHQYTSRTIDLDILFYDDLVMDNLELTLPHPRLHLRKFTLIPLVELAPDLEHPTLKRSIRDLERQCQDTSEVRHYEE